MKIEVKIPAFGESVAKVHIGRFLKKEGASVAQDEEIVELETDKASQALRAPQAGVLTWKVKEGEDVSVGAVIGWIDAEKKPQEKKEEVAPKVAPSSAHRKKMSPLRKAIAEKLVQVQKTAAILTTFNEIDMTRVMEMRARHKEVFEKKHGVKLGLMSFFTKAVVEALKAVPELNAFIEGDEIVQHESFDIGVAVGTERGVLVPVLRGCDKLSYAEIERQLLDYAEKARRGSISAEALQGGSFTITNGGVYGSLLSTPLLNPPQSGILGLHKIEKRPVVIDDAIVSRQMMYVALSYDHRLIDGKEAITFLVHIKEHLEDPSRFLLEL